MIVLLGFAALVSCSKSHPTDTTSGTTTLTGGSVTGAPSAEEIRVVVMQAEPDHPELAAFDITADGSGRVTVRGVAPDEKTHRDIVDHIKSVRGVKDVRDEVRVASPSATTQTVRASMKHDQPTSAAVIEHLVISDDGSAVLIEGVVPDDATHDALIKSAQNASNGKSITDKLRVSGK
jgi:hypothetical protein